MTDQLPYQPYPPYPARSYTHPGRPYPVRGSYPTAVQPMRTQPADPTAVVGRRVGQYVLDALLVGLPLMIIEVGLFVWLLVRLAHLAETPAG